jgi:hypothetical protein
MGLLCCLLWRVLGARVRDGYTFPGLAGIRGHARRPVSPCGTPRRRSEAARLRESPCTRAHFVVLLGKIMTPSLQGGGRLSGSARSAKSCEPEGPQDLTSRTPTGSRFAVKQPATALSLAPSASAMPEIAHRFHVGVLMPSPVIASSTRPVRPWQEPIAGQRLPRKIPRTGRRSLGASLGSAASSRAPASPWHWRSRAPRS